jgi:hypothetical protein
MTKDEAQRRNWTFYEAINFKSKMISKQPGEGDAGV